MLSKEMTENFPYKNLIEQHQSRAKVLFIIVSIYAVVAIAAYVLTRSADANKAMVTTLAVVLVVGAVAIAFQTYRVGELGSKIVYNPDGNVDFGSD